MILTVVDSLDSEYTFARHMYSVYLVMKFLCLYTYTVSSSSVMVVIKIMNSFFIIELDSGQSL